MSTNYMNPCGQRPQQAPTHGRGRASPMQTVHNAAVRGAPQPQHMHLHNQTQQAMANMYSQQAQQPKYLGAMNNYAHVTAPLAAGYPQPFYLMPTQPGAAGAQNGNTGAERSISDRFQKLYDGEEDRFVKAFRVSKVTFDYILMAVEADITKQDIGIGDVIPNNIRLAVCLARLTRGEYFFAIAEDYGIGETTAQGIYNEVTRAIVKKLYAKHVTNLLPKTEADMLNLQSKMQFPYAFAAIDGCHIRIQCPFGKTARKDYYNFKNFYSIILLAMVDGSGRFLWANAGMPGNCSDSTLLQSSKIWTKLKSICELTTERIGDLLIPAMILGDNAFPFRRYLMKRYSNAVKTDEQRKFNKALSSDRVIVENAFGYLKMRFRELFRGSESDPQNLTYGILAAVTLHNMLMDVEGPPAGEFEGEDIVFLEHAHVREQNDAASRVRELILPLVQ